MADNSTENPEVNIASGTYEVLRKRLSDGAVSLSEKLQKLNVSRKEVFGSIETKLIATERINTQNNCVPRDMIPVGNKFIFGYNVFVGLRSEVLPKDVFSIYTYNENFKEETLELINNAEFEKEFKDVYKYYKTTVFTKFVEIGPFLFMVFQIGKLASDFKAFKWQINEDDSLTYIGSRYDHEVANPAQHEFEWKKVTRDAHRKGDEPHVSILDRVFVETIKGDLTIKVEDNTNDGKGIYSEAVDNKDQTLDDADYHYVDLGSIILLKIKPYQEDPRYFIFNEKLSTVVRVDAIETACLLLPDDQGIIFPNGFYLQNGASKTFELDIEGVGFDKKIVSPNGEDNLYVFYQESTGTYSLFSYNIINQKAAKPIICSGYSFFDDGSLCYFSADEDPQKHHVIQIWQTPYTETGIADSGDASNYLYKIGNKDVVKAMSEGNELVGLLKKGENYQDLYYDIKKLSTDVLDSYYWLNKSEAFNISESIEEIKSTAELAIDEFDKVVRARKNTNEISGEVFLKLDNLIKKLKSSNYDKIYDFVEVLSVIRNLRGEAISLRDLRYADLEKIEGYEEILSKLNETQSESCIQFLLKKESLNPYSEKVLTIEGEIAKVLKVQTCNIVNETINKTAGELEMLIDVVSNLKIKDTTQTTKIVDNISKIYSKFNQLRSKLRGIKKSLMLREGKSEFAAQIKLVEQSLGNYIDISDTQEKCDEYLNKVMVKLEELEGRFSDFPEFIEIVIQKREEVYNIFENKKAQVLEQFNKKSNALLNSANRILKGVKNKLSQMDSVSEINSYLASDIMVDKVRDIIKQLEEMKDSVKADEIQSKLKSTQEDSIRQLKDRKELFVDGENIISFGKRKFSVNTQPLDLTIVPKGNDMYFHLTGTNFYDKLEDEAFYQFKKYWSLHLPSENKAVYRSEFLAFSLYKEIESGDHEDTLHFSEEELLEFVQKQMASRYEEGYLKGVHDFDAAKILRKLIELNQSIGLLRFSNESRVKAQLFWKYGLDEAQRKVVSDKIKSLSLLLSVFPSSNEMDDLISNISLQIDVFAEGNELLQGESIDSSKYLFEELKSNSRFVIDHKAWGFKDAFNKFLVNGKHKETYLNSLKKFSETNVEKFVFVKKWVDSYADSISFDEAGICLEAAMLVMDNSYEVSQVSNVETGTIVSGLVGEHSKVSNGELSFKFIDFVKQLSAFEKVEVPNYKAFLKLKKTLVSDFKETLKLEEFKPRVLSSFVRNRLINEVYLPIIGDNLAKQIGEAGENKRTDLMGMLLLISPPGYGKTTLMEYVSSRLGLIFMKINGPALGHSITSIDPALADNSATRDELKKLNLAFEMGDNVMIYLDDIQHCNPEFLQKFISLCDGQRKIEGVYKGKSKTYDLRGKKVCVVMAGNPYTESGDKFQIPDMLTNRADTYNLGDILGGSEKAFKLSYIENCLTSNSVLSKLSSKSQKDLYSLIEFAETGNSENLRLESNITSDDITEITSVLKKLFVARDVILKVNQQYIESAAQSDEYRLEPVFKLQGSYRDMNKISAKIVPIMNNEELEEILTAHYESESQTLTSNAESNLLKFKSLTGYQSEADLERWNSIVDQFKKNNKYNGVGGDNMGKILLEMDEFNLGLKSLKEVIENGLNGVD
jgi:hypothetical protein